MCWICGAFKPFGRSCSELWKEDDAKHSNTTGSPRCVSTLWRGEAEAQGEALINVVGTRVQNQQISMQRCGAAGHGTLTVLSLLSSSRRGNNPVSVAENARGGRRARPYGERKEDLFAIEKTRSYEFKINKMCRWAGDNKIRNNLEESDDCGGEEGTG